MQIEVIYIPPPQKKRKEYSSWTKKRLQKECI